MKKLCSALIGGIICMASLTQAAPDGLSEMDEAIARIQIQDVLFRYALYHNTDKAEEYANLFTEDADLMGIAIGRPAILEMAKGEVTKMAKLGTTEQGEFAFGFMRSHIINPVIDVIDSTHARAFSYLQVVVPNVDNDNIPTILSQGSYEDELAKVDGKWLISKRRAYGGMSYPGLGAKLGLGPAAPRKE